MKATIESRLNLDYDMDRVKRQFDKIIDIILFSKDRIQLKDILSRDDIEDDLCHFEWGFGGSHFWVNQKGFGERRIFVEL